MGLALYLLRKLAEGYLKFVVSTDTDMCLEVKTWFSKACDLRLLPWFISCCLLAVLPLLLRDCSFSGLISDSTLGVGLGAAGSSIIMSWASWFSKGKLPSAWSWPPCSFWCLLLAALPLLLCDDVFWNTWEMCGSLGSDPDRLGLGNFPLFTCADPVDVSSSASSWSLQGLASNRTWIDTGNLILRCCSEQDVKNAVLKEQFIYSPILILSVGMCNTGFNWAEEVLACHPMATTKSVQVNDLPQGDWQGSYCTVTNSAVDIWCGVDWKCRSELQYYLQPTQAEMYEMCLPFCFEVCDHY